MSIDNSIFTLMSNLESRMVSTYYSKRAVLPSDIQTYCLLKLLLGFDSKDFNLGSGSGSGVTLSELTTLLNTELINLSKLPKLDSIDSKLDLSKLTSIETSVNDILQQVQLLNSKSNLVDTDFFSIINNTSTSVYDTGCLSTKKLFSVYVRNGTAAVRYLQFFITSTVAAGATPLISIEIPASTRQTIGDLFSIYGLALSNTSTETVKIGWSTTVNTFTGVNTVRDILLIHEA